MLFGAPNTALASPLPPRTSDLKAADVFTPATSLLTSHP